jgi:hypothetical protein
MPSKSVLIAQAFSKTGVLSTVVDSAPSVNTGQVDVATAAELPSTGNTQGDFAFVQATNRLYIWNGSGWYNIALINTTPTWDSNGQPNATYELSSDSPQTATTITLAASDPEGISINYSYVTGGSMDSIATVSQDSSVFTITPKTSTQAPDGGTGSITFRASDDINILPYVSSFTLSFISIVSDSKHTTLLVTATGTSDNNNITDASTNNYTITVNGDAHTGTFSPYRSGGYSGLFDSTSVVQLSFGGSSDFEFSSINFTIEMWFKWNSSSKPETTIFSNRISESTFNTGKYFLKLMPGDTTSGGIEFSFDCGSPRYRLYCVDNLTADNAFFDEGWHHYAAVRNGTSLKLFVDGQEVDEITLPHNETNFGNSSDNIGLGINSSVSSPTGPDGEYRDVRIVKGVAITPPSGGPTETLGAVSGTTFLLYNGEGYVKDKTSNHSPIYGSTAPTITATSPYDYNEYDAADHGGSVYFGGGTREHLSTSLPAFGTQDFEVEFWIYGGALTSSTWYTLFSRNYNVNGSFRIYCAAGSDVDKFIYIANGTEYNYTSAGKIRDNVWNHILLSRVSGTAKWFINGIEDTSWSDSENMTSTATLYIGDTGADETSNSSYPFVGYMSDIAIRMGGSGYRTSSFVPPTTSLSSTGAELHIKGTDASIIDKSQSANLKLFGDTTGSTTQAKFSNTKSMAFDGTDDKISLGNLLYFGDNNSLFSLEMWARFDTLSHSSGYLTLFGEDDGNYGKFWFGVRNSKLAYKIDSNVLQSGSATLSTNTWYHFAFVRSGLNTGHAAYPSTRTFVNGTLDQTDSTWRSPYTFPDNPTYLGAATIEQGNMDGYIQDFRFRKNYVGWALNGSTYTYPVPTAPLEG